MASRYISKSSGIPGTVRGSPTRPKQDELTVRSAKPGIQVEILKKKEGKEGGGKRRRRKGKGGDGGGSEDQQFLPLPSPSTLGAFQVQNSSVAAAITCSQMRQVCSFLVSA